MKEKSRTLHINGTTYSHRFVNRTILEPFDLLAFVANAHDSIKVYWQGRDGMEVAALGSILTLSSPPIFEKENASPARFWGGHAFFKDFAPKDSVWRSLPRICFFLPQTEIIQKNGQCTVITNSLDTVLKERELKTGIFEAEKIDFETPSHFPSEENWIKLINQSLQKIRTFDFEKVVLARRTTYSLAEEANPFAILSRLKAQNAIRFAVQFKKGTVFFGATPERLYRREEDKIYTEAIAGTRKRGKTEAEDKALEKELLENAKERQEFAFVKQSIEENLKPLCKLLRSQKEDDVIKTPNVQHLHNAFEGILCEGIDDGVILNSMHPTAAMGGLPKQPALEYLRRNEPFERGWYASPLGYCSAKEAEFAVGIRSALVEKKQIHFFAGTGIIESSIPEKEWEELEHKISLWKQNQTEPCSTKFGPKLLSPN